MSDFPSVDELFKRAGLISEARAYAMGRAGMLTEVLAVVRTAMEENVVFLSKRLSNIQRISGMGRGVAIRSLLARLKRLKP